VKITILRLRKLIREALSEASSMSMVGPTPSGAVDPTKKDEPLDLGLAADVQRLHKGFYPSAEEPASAESAAPEESAEEEK